MTHRDSQDEPHGYPALSKPYLVFVGDVTDPLDAKTGSGFVHWRHDWCAGQLRLTADTVDLGLADMTVQDALGRGIRTMLVGISPLGGGLSPAWVEPVAMALRGGMDVVSGLHVRLSEDPQVATALANGTGRVHELRHLHGRLPLGTPRRRSGLRCLTVGADCCVGKMFTALSLDRAIRERGGASRFCATGQTGMMIAEDGLCIDAIVSDFLAGSLEVIAPDAPDGTWQIIEGQGSLFHPSYAGVTLGLVHGAQPDALVFCMIAGQEALLDFPQIALPSIEDSLARYLEAARLTNPDARFVGVSVNTAAMDRAERERHLDDLEDRLGLPCVDPVATSVGPIADALTERATG